MLADVALGDLDPPAGRIYVSLLKGEPPTATHRSWRAFEQHTSSSGVRAPPMVGLA